MRRRRRLHERLGAMDEISGDSSFPLLTFYRGWDRFNQLLITAVAPLEPEQLELCAAPSLRPLWQLGAHIIGARIRWFQRTMGEGSDDLAPFQTWDSDGASPRSAAELELGLDRTWALIEDC